MKFRMVRISCLIPVRWLNPQDLRTPNKFILRFLNLTPSMLSCQAFNSYLPYYRQLQVQMFSFSDL